MRRTISAPQPGLGPGTNHEGGKSVPTIGLLWGDFPWEEPPRKLGKLLSWGAVARNISQVLRSVGTLIPYRSPPSSAPQEEHDAALVAFLQSIDLLWADCYPTSAAALHLRHRHGLPCQALLFAGGTLPKGVEAMLFPWQEWLRPDDVLIVTCQADHGIWQRLVDQSALPVWVLPCPVDDLVFHPSLASEGAAARLRHGLPVDAPLLLYVGRLNIQKNLHTLLRMLAAVRRQIPDTHLCLVGEEDDILLGEFGARNTGYVTWLRRLAGELGVAEAITVLEPRFGEELAALYNAADIVVNASVYHRENFGLSQAEAQACGVPVVCSDWGGFKDVVRQAETGYLMETALTKHGVRVGWESGVNAIIRLLRNPALRTTMGARAAAWAREQFTVAAVAQQLSDYLEGLEQVASRSRGEAAALVPYQPSAFARRYERHKRVCGWHEPPAANGPMTARWFPAMYQGRDYALYEYLMGPYATRLAGGLLPTAIPSTWAPYAPSGLELDPVRRIARDLDPIWPSQRWLAPLEWEALSRVDGARTIAQIAADIQEGDVEGITVLLWQLHLEGLIMFRENQG